MSHIPVMLEQVVEYLELKKNGIYFDCTFGAGGYSKRIVESNEVNLYAIDQDPNVSVFVDKINSLQKSGKFIFTRDNFSNIYKIAQENNIDEIDGAVFDLGVSSMQVDEAHRGFSFNKDAKLDMRMSGQGKTAADVVNSYSESDLADIIYYYGDERFARRIARIIVESRKSNPIETTLDLSKLVCKVAKQQGKIHPATKTFQALRIYVNDELGALKKALEDSYKLLKNNGKLVVVTFQGLEDKVVKEFAKNIKAKISKSIKPQESEIRNNPRARSAKLRVITKIGELK